MKKLSAVFAGGLLLVAGSLAQAQTEDSQCATVRLADPGWSDIAVTNSVASLLFKGLGYEPKLLNLAVPIIYAGLEKGQVDVFLGNWMPAQKDNYEKYVASGKVDEVAENLTGTEFTLAVPTYVWEGGVKTFADLDTHADQFDSKLYGIGSGAPANLAIQKMIKEDKFGLADWTLVESSEQAMLVQVGRAVKRDKAVVFLGWTPHPMNVQFDMKYLKGGEEFFGDSGAVNTVTRKGYVAQCPNAGKLLTNLKFEQDMENAVMDEVLAKKASNDEAVKAWIMANPQVLESWLEGVTTLDGGDGLAAVKATLQ